MGRDRVEADVSEEDRRRAREHSQRFAARSRLAEERFAEEADAGQAIGCKRLPVLGIHIKRADDEHEENDGDLHDHHGSIEASTLSDADDQNGSDEPCDQEGRQIKDRAGGCELAGRGVEIEGRV